MTSCEFCQYCGDCMTCYGDTDCSVSPSGWCYPYPPIDVEEGDD